MRARNFLVGVVAVVLVFALANACWADGRKTAGYRAVPPGHGWYKHPCQHARCEYTHRYPYREVVHRYYYVPAPGPVYVPAPVYGGGYISGAVSQSGWGFSWSVNLP